MPVQQSIPDLCSHDAPGQLPGTKCIRCGKELPGEAPVPAKPLKAEKPSTSFNPDTFKKDE